MGRQRGQTSVEVRNLVIKHFSDGKSVREIGKIVDRSHSTVHNIIKRFKSFNSVENRAKGGRKRIFTDSDERWIVQQIKKNPRLSAPKLTALASQYLKKDANTETVRNILRKNNFHGRVARKKPLISKKNKINRLKFAREYQSKDLSFWKTVLFADESKFNLFRSDGRSYVWRKPNEELRERNLRPTVKHGGGSIMVWGCMSAAGPGNLCIIEGNMDHKMYLEILKNNLKESARKLGIVDNFYYYQDNDPKHKAQNVKMWLLYNCPHVLETPAQSPDLNPIEHLWAHLEDRLKNILMHLAKVN